MIGFIVLYRYLNEGQLTVSNENELESLWNDARILGLVNLEKVCIQQLTDTISLNSWIQRLEFSQAEGCHELESKVLSFANDNFEKCCRISSFTSLSVDQVMNSVIFFLMFEVFLFVTTNFMKSYPDGPTATIANCEDNC